MKSKEIEVEEYKQKWAYVMHTEVMQSRYIQWYFGVVATVLAFIYGGKLQSLQNIAAVHWIPLTVLVLYSILVNLRLLLQKRNYETYTKRLRQLEGQKQSKEQKTLRGKIFSVFRVEYYSVVIAGAVVVAVLLLEITKDGFSAIFDSAIYIAVMVTISFLVYE